MAHADISPERREQRRRRRRRKRQARINPVSPPAWMNHQHHSALPPTKPIHSPRKRSVSLDEQTPTTQEPTLIDTTFDDDYDESVQAISILHDDDWTMQASSTLETPTPRLPDESTLDGSLFSDRYSVTVSHHRKVTAIPLPPSGETKQQQRHRKAVELLRKSRRQHVHGTDGTSSGSYTSESDVGTIGDFTFIGELQAVASDVSFFFASLKESLTDPHVAACCARPTYISYRKRKPRHRR